MVTLADLSSAIAQLVGLTLIVAAVAGAVAFLYRWYVRERLPDGLAVLVGLGVVAISIGTTGWLNQVIGGSDTLLSATTALRNIGVFVVSAGGAVAGARVGDRLARDVAAATGSSIVDDEVSTLVEAVGRVITVELPAEIDDVVGYDPVAPRTKEALEGRTFLFPRRLTVAELRERLLARLKTDYAVGHVDVEIAADGTVAYLALGSRAAGIGPTLPPETAAVAIRADPAYAASAGDLVQVWEQNPSRRILTAELRGAADDVVTLAIDAADTPKLDPETRYRLVTLPVDDRPDREFASLLRAADETMAAIAVAEGSALVGRSIREFGVSVAAIVDPDAGTTTLPTGDRAVASGDVLYAIGAPEALRKLEEAAGTADEGATTQVSVGSTGSDTADGATEPIETAPAADVESTDAVEPATNDPADGGEGGDAATEDGDGTTAEPVPEKTPVFEPGVERDPLVDAAPDDEAPDTSETGDDAVADADTADDQTADEGTADGAAANETATDDGATTDGSTATDGDRA